MELANYLLGVRVIIAANPCGLVHMRVVWSPSDKQRLPACSGGAGML